MGHDTDLRNALSAVATSYNTVAPSIYSHDLPGAYQAYTEKVSSGGMRTYRIDFGGATPTAREWKGSKIHKQWRNYSHSLELQFWEQTADISRRDLTYSNGVNAISSRLGAFLSETSYTYDERSFAALVANGTGYDGVALFASTHPHGQTTNSNTGTATLTKANVVATDLAMAKWRDEFNQPIGQRGNTILCGPDLEDKAREIFETGDRVISIDTSGAEATEFNIGATTKQNIYQGTKNVIIDPRFADGTRNYYWYIIDGTKPQKPLILVEGQAPRPVKQDSLDSPRRFEFDEFSYSVEFDMTVGPGFWYTVYRQAATS